MKIINLLVITTLVTTNFLSVSQLQSSNVTAEQRSQSPTTAIKIDLNVAKQAPRVHNCFAYATANATQFFANPTNPDFQKSTAHDSLVQKVMETATIFGMNLADGIDIEAARQSAGLFPDSLQQMYQANRLAILDMQEIFTGWGESETILQKLASKFSAKSSEPVGALMLLTDGYHAHWVFIGISQTATGLQVVIPESAHNDYVSSHLKSFLEPKVVHLFE